ncbi:MAG: GTP-binding protein [Eubacterium aggregans]|uniref:CobW/HypB/UreG, nucleotide-binding domain n=1 Tax=Eubacterium aggregans TaxID=81409 RepID=A0A1H4A3N9_9FIRM|nr:GTP-binding protein [Eubacterium aggregans]MDD4691644.1 GTP-binding protein [Eubacterium aggregans]MEA5074262.1 GTP-binding protein [Eubacterium aggregans]SEA30114.1 CobW/HypB/UreG, nucleotide-binding domain [Eubacterium aggregans]
MKSRKPTIILFTGFLGSGKTSLLLKTIDVMIAKEKKCAIIINEIGDVGIDNREMRHLGYDVWDLFGGCVCCTMKVTLEATINHLLENNPDLDYIFFEPSGMAEPESLYPAMENCGYEREEIRNVFILDPMRTGLYRVRLRELFKHSLHLAQAVVINKIDIAPEESVEEALEMVRSEVGQMPVFKLNLKDDALTDAFCTFIQREGD